MEMFLKLSRAEMRHVLGGELAPPSNCTADCGGGRSVECAGPSCTSKDGVGCTGGSGDGAVSQSC